MKNLNDIFNQDLAYIVEELDSKQCYPPNYTVCSIIAAASSAIGLTHSVNYHGLTQYANLYITLVGPPNACKSHPLNFAYKPLYDHATKLYDLFKAQKQLYKQSRKDKVEGIVEPTEQKIIVNDFTPEALFNHLHNNPLGLALHSDELMGLFKMLNRYAKGNAQENLLSSWNNQPIFIDRKSSDPIHIPRPYLTIAGTVQNNILQELGKEGRGQNGFLDRILFTIITDFTKRIPDFKPIDPFVKERYAEIMGKLLSLRETTTEITNIGFDDSVLDNVQYWFELNASKCNEASTDELKSCFGKMDILFLRICLILHLLEWACSEECEVKLSINFTTVERAFHLMIFFQEEAETVHKLLYGNVSETLPKQMAEFYNDMPDAPFARKDVLHLAEEHKVAPNTLQRFLQDKRLFQKLRTGVYTKMS